MAPCGPVGLAQVVAQFRQALQGELDYRHEAANLRTLGELLQPYDRLLTAEPIDQWSGTRVLTMSLVEGRSLTTVEGGGGVPANAAAAVGQLFKAYLDQVLVHGVFHADPHPGNVLITPDGCLALIDVGMTARVAPDLQEALLRMLVALGDGRGPEVADALERAGERLDDFDHGALTREVSALVVATAHTGVADLEVGRQLSRLTRVAVACGLRPAPELAMVGKALLSLDDVARRLAPDSDPTTAVLEHTVSLLWHRLAGTVSPSNLVSAALDAKDLMEHLPQRLDKILGSLADGPLRISVDGLDEAEIMRSVQKLANRGAAGLGVVALVLAASIFSISSAGPRLWGVSAFTVVLLAVAFVVAGSVLVSTARNDLPQSRRRTARHRR